MSASLAVQKAIRDRLVATEGVTDLVAEESILDRNERPAPFPSIILGEDQEVDEERIARDTVRVYSTLHVWNKEKGLMGVKRIAGAIRTALRARLTATGFHIGDSFVASSRFIRDEDAETAHAIVTVETLVKEIA